MNAEIIMRECVDGNTEIKIKGLASDIIPMVLGLVEEVAKIHADQMGRSKYASLMAMACCIRDMAESGDDHEDGGLS